MTDCIFCKIIKGDIPSYKVYEDNDALAFLDLSQTTKGHLLLIPKKHVKNVYEMDETTASQVFKLIPKLSRALKETFPNMQGLNIVNNNDELAGQTVFHSHIHFIPRYPNDDFNIQFTNHQESYTQEELENIAEKLKKEVNK